MTDPINPDHYRDHPSGIECIQITEHMNFCLGNAIKYIWRAGLKSEDATQDLDKAIWYLQRERARLAMEEPADMNMEMFIGAAREMKFAGDVE